MAMIQMNISSMISICIFILSFELFKKTLQKKSTTDIDLSISLLPGLFIIHVSHEFDCLLIELNC